jgi:hypothetical protein
MRLPHAQVHFRGEIHRLSEVIDTMRLEVNLETLGGPTEDVLCYFHLGQGIQIRVHFGEVPRVREIVRHHNCNETRFPGFHPHPFGLREEEVQQGVSSVQLFFSSGTQSGVSVSGNQGMGGGRGFISFELPRKEDRPRGTLRINVWPT